MSRRRALFFGTPEIAVPALRALAEIADVAAVVCQPDKPAGRDQALRPPAVKLAATELGLPVHQPTKVRTPDFPAWIRAQAPDFVLVMAYGRILTPEVLAAPPRGCLNLHASLLPRYRGAAPITWAVVRGEAETGISLMAMDAGVDTGPVFTTRSIPIGPDETAGEVADRLAALAAEVVRLDLPGAVDGRLVAKPQDDEAATLAPILKKEDGRVDWSQPAARVHDHVRGMSPWPGAFTTVRGKSLKILRTERLPDTKKAGAAGTVTRADKERIVVACGEGAIGVARAQLEGRKPLDARELVAGRAVVEGDVLGA